MSYKIVINIIPAGDETYERFEQICYTLPETINEKGAIRLVREHADGINKTCETWKAISIHVYENSDWEVMSQEL